MGGDGGTLNNSRGEHLALRRSVARDSASEAALRARSSVTECSVSGAPLDVSDAVVDRLGQLYNREALLSALLARAESDNASDPNEPLRHIRRLTRDVATARMLPGYLCALTRRALTPESRGAVGWKCGCVVVLRDFEGNPFEAVDGAQRECPVCNETGEWIAIGQTLRERMAAREVIETAEKKRKKRKRERDVQKSARKRAIFENSRKELSLGEKSEKENVKADTGSKNSEDGKS